MALNALLTPPKYTSKPIDFFSLFSCLPKNATRFASNSFDCVEENQRTVNVLFDTSYLSIPTVKVWLVTDREKGMLQVLSSKNMIVSQDGFELRMQVSQRLWKKGASLNWIAFLQESATKEKDKDKDKEEENIKHSEWQIVEPIEKTRTNNFNEKPKLSEQKRKTEPINTTKQTVQIKTIKQTEPIKTTKQTEQKKTTKQTEPIKKTKQTKQSEQVKKSNTPKLTDNNELSEFSEVKDIHSIASVGTLFELKQYLLLHPKQINDQDDLGNSPLMSAIVSYNWENALFLCEQKDIAFRATTLNGRSALHLLATKALEYNVTVSALEKLINVLIDNCPVNSCDNNGCTALHYAVIFTPGVSNSSLAKSTSPKLPIHTSANAGTIASDYYHCYLCSALMKNGALEVKDKSLNFPSDYARDLNLTQIVEIFSDHKETIRVHVKDGNFLRNRISVLFQTSTISLPPILEEEFIVIPDSVEDLFNDKKSTAFAFIHSFVDAIKQDSFKYSLEEEGKTVRQFLFGLETKVRAYPRWKKLDDEQVLALQDELSYRIFKEIYTIEMNKALDKERDTILFLRFSYLCSCLTLKDLDVNNITPDSLYEAQQHLLSMQNEITPHRKMKAVMNASKSIMALLQSVGKQGSADDFFPLLVFSTLTCGLKTIASEIRFVDSYYPTQYSSNVLSYFFLSFKAAITFLESAEVDELIEKHPVLFTKSTGAQKHNRSTEPLIYVSESNPLVN